MFASILIFPADSNLKYDLNMFGEWVTGGGSCERIQFWAVLEIFVFLSANPFSLATTFSCYTYFPFTSVHNLYFVLTLIIYFQKKDRDKQNYSNIILDNINIREKYTLLLKKKC